MITPEAVTVWASAAAAFEPDIAIALTAYNVLKSIWTSINPGKSEADYQAYLQASSQTNVDTTAAYLTAQGYVQDAAGKWSKP